MGRNVAKLYQYLSFAQLEVLRHARLQARPVLEARDPFELNRPALNPAMVPVPISEIEYQQELKRQYEALPESMRAIVSFDYFRQQAAGKRKEIEQAMKKSRQPKPPRLPDPKPYAKLSSCRFFASATNPALWERYGDRYRGLVLEFDARHAYFTSKSYQGRPQILRPVTYTDERPQAGAAQSKAGQQPFPALFHKAKVWAYEQEWRLIRPQAAADKSLQDSSGTLLLFDFPPACLTGIVMGCNARESDREQLRKILSYDMRYKKLALKQLMLDPFAYKLHVRRCL